MRRPLIVAALVLAACGGGATRPPTPTAPPTPTPAPTATRPASMAEVVVTVPTGWQQVVMTRDALEAQVKTLRGSNPQLAASLQTALSSGLYEAYRFYAIDY